VQRQRLYFFLYYLVGWMGHGLWNMVALLPVAAFPDVGADCNSTAALSGPGALISLFALLVFGLILLAAALWIVWLVRWTKRIDRREAAGASSG
jgi:hypothetical protein